MAARAAENAAFIAEIKEARTEYREAVANIHLEARMEREASEKHWRAELQQLSHATREVSVAVMQVNQVIVKAVEAKVKGELR
jgi:hypothetical protein